jgi:hypothetical protein
MNSNSAFLSRMDVIHFHSDRPSRFYFASSLRRTTWIRFTGTSSRGRWREEGFQRVDPEFFADTLGIPDLPNNFQSKLTGEALQDLGILRLPDPTSRRRAD